MRVSIEKRFINGPRAKKGNVKPQSHGLYIRIKKPDHKFASKRGYIYYHRYVYETFYKCSLLPFAIVHHINGNKKDNRIENLEAMLEQTHNDIHKPKGEIPKDRICQICGSDTTYVYTRGKKKGYSDWTRNKEGEGFLCKKCGSKQRKRLKRLQK
jgi:hypothetical protein